MKEITLKEFDDICRGGDSKIPLSELFQIKCLKCGCKSVEIFGTCETESGYYESITAEGKTLIKCHDCGNAKAFRLNSDGNLDELK